MLFQSISVLLISNNLSPSRFERWISCSSSVQCGFGEKWTHSSSIIPGHPYVRHESKFRLGLWPCFTWYIKLIGVRWMSAVAKLCKEWHIRKDPQGDSYYSSTSICTVRVCAWLFHSGTVRLLKPSQRVDHFSRQTMHIWLQALKHFSSAACVWNLFVTVFSVQEVNFCRLTWWRRWKDSFLGGESFACIPT